jgi:hypothetical protein
MISADEPFRGAFPETRMCHIPFASCYVYSPGHLCAESRLLRLSVKAGNVRSLLDIAIRYDADAPYFGLLARFFPADAILVPIPGSRPHLYGRVSATERLALALMRRGLGARMWCGLRRVGSVRKSGTAPLGSRPSVRAHFDSMAVRGIEIPGASPVVLIDDVVTKGRTLLAAALRLREVLPRADIRAFALLRTLGYTRVAGGSLMPCVGSIEWRREDTRRTP